jgi:hypothetical protein
MDDPERNLMILYRLDPAPGKDEESAPAQSPLARKAPTPKPLVTKVGQQPSTEQLQH